MKNLIVVGAGGYAQEVVWLVDDINRRQQTWNVLGYIDPQFPERRGSSLYDRPILGTWSDIPSAENLYFACGIGSPDGRKKECEEAERHGLKAATLVHPSVSIARHVLIGEGTLIGAGCVLAPYSSIGRHCALNIGVIVGHNSKTGDYCVLSPSARILGAAVLEDLVFLGSDATVNVGRKIGSGAVVGANSFQLTDLDPGVSVLGVPARPISPARR